MTAWLLSILAVTFLTEPGLKSPVRPPRPVAPSAVRAAAPKAVVSSARVTSRSCDLDGAAGVVMFEGGVVVSYSETFVMCADKVYMFLAGSNDVSRVVAVGGVTITNETRVGSCALATYRRRKGEIEMLGDGERTVARLAERSGAERTVIGSRILFWLDSEQVRVEDSRILSERPKGGEVL